jgi:hypothetical protein
VRPNQPINPPVDGKQRLGEKLTVLYLLHDNFLSKTNKTDDESSRRATWGGTGAFFKDLHSEIMGCLLTLCDYVKDLVPLLVEMSQLLLLLLLLLVIGRCPRYVL